MAASDRDPVRAQYEAWVYPPPIEDLSGYTQRGIGDPSLLGLAYWPDRPPRDDLKVLVAGCGPNAAPRLAFQNRGYRVVGVDVSEASLSHARRLKEKHDLENLELHHGRIEDVSKLRRTFDFIHCTGVLHHLKSPVEGLEALAAVLERDGALLLMLYAKYGRTGVYMVQDLLRLLGLGQSSADVALARQAVTQAGKDHPVRLFERTADLRHDAGVVDLLLHPQDRAYTVDECLELVAAAKLQFQGWEQNHLYYPEILLPPGSELYRRINELPEREIWKATELLHGTLTMHSFYACRRERTPQTYALSFDGESFIDRVPVAADGVSLSVEPAGVTLEQSRIGKISFRGIPAAIVRAIDGKRTIRECAQAAAAPSSGAVEICRDTFRVLWRLGMHHLVHPRAVGRS